MNRRRLRLIVYGTLTLTVMAGIFMMSAKDGTQSGSLSDWLVQTPFGRALMKILPELTGAGAGRDIRKYAHMAEFFILSLPATLFFAELFCERVPKRALPAALVFCFLYACSDEFHQLFVPGRVGDFRDVLTDLAGAVPGPALIWLTRKEKT